VGIYVQGYGTLASSNAENLAERLTGSARRWAGERGLQDLFLAGRDGADVWLTFYPPAGSTTFEIRKGSISFGTKTSVSGPGYHAALIELCDRLQSDLGVRWRWESGGDGTDYAVERDGNRLRSAFLDQVIGYCEIHAKYVRPGDGSAINLPEGMAAYDHGGVATPLGILPDRLLRDVPNSDADAEALARRIFPWWAQNLDREFWVNTLRAVFWTEVSWRAPRTTWESHIDQVVHSLAARLGTSVDADLAMGVGELDALSIDRETFNPPSPTGIGYLRHKRTFFLTGGWRIDLPGYYIEQLEDEGNTVCLWFGDEEIRGSFFIITPDAGREDNAFAWDEELAGQPDRNGNGFTYRLVPAPRPASHPGFHHAKGEFQTYDAEGNVVLMILSLFGVGEDLSSRLSEVAECVRYEEPRRAAGAHDH
jgi:hypothetical protein